LWATSSSMTDIGQSYETSPEAAHIRRHCVVTPALHGRQLEFDLRGRRLRL
jgi:hypothetical protein